MAEPAVDPEAYTIAILLAEMLRVDDFRQRVKVYATDVDDAAMATARLARYRLWGLRECEAHGRPFLNLDVGLPVDRLRQALQAVVDGAQPLVEMALASTDRLGRPVLCQVTCSPLRDGHGQVSGAIVLLAESALQESTG